jgi:hypothetical protein
VACITYGITREKDVFNRIADKSKGPVNAVNMLVSIQEMAADFAAIFNPEHPKWNDYNQSVRGALAVLMEIDAKQMRPLILAVVRNFTPSQASVTLNALVSWAVRMTVAGGSKAGRLDSFYANLGYRVNIRGKDDSINNYEELLAAASHVIPQDNEFRAEFEKIRVKVSKVARYYLRCLEQTAREVREPAWIPNDDPTTITLEHVMPKTFSEEFGASRQDIETHATRLGNLALLQSSVNVSVDRKPFDKKAPILGESLFLLTEMIGKQFTSWGAPEIEARQRKLAEYAPATWPLKPKK